MQWTSRRVSFLSFESRRGAGSATDRLHVMPHAAVSRVASCSDLQRVTEFYATLGHDVRPCADERVFIAEQSDRIVGAVRLCHVDEPCLILRTMRVSDSFQRQGVGTGLLSAAVGPLVQECCCLPWEHLAAFYGRGGFVTIAPEQAPPRLRERYQAHRNQGHRVIVMKRPAVNLSEA